MEVIWLMSYRMSDRENELLRARVIKFITDYGANMAFIAAEAGISHSTLKKFKTGERGMTSDNAMLLSAFLDKKEKQLMQ